MLEVAKFVHNNDYINKKHNYVIADLKKQLRIIKSKYLIND
jgi:hypothetical protein